ncbi:hypothetical protein LPLM1_00015 [Listeria phage LPML1]|nr:hypothetical protein LPLM1_00015 [Listeria phage LPML1]
MAIGSGWVGSSAVAETGQRWMSAARTTVRLSASGWMSELVGKSKADAIMTVGKYTNGAITALGYIAGGQTATGSLTGTIGGYRVDSLSTATLGGQYPAATMVLSTMPNKNWVLNIDGTNFTFTPTFSSGKLYQYDCTNPTGLINLLNPRVGKQIPILVVS